MTAPVDVAKVRDEMAKALDGVTLTPRGALIYPADFVHLSVRFLVDHGPALLAAYEAVRGMKAKLAEAEMFQHLVIGEGQWDRFADLRQRAEAAERNSRRYLFLRNDGDPSFVVTGPNRRAIEGNELDAEIDAWLVPLDLGGA